MQHLPLGCVWHRVGALADNAKAANVCLLNDKWASVAMYLLFVFSSGFVNEWIFLNCCLFPAELSFSEVLFNICEISWGCCTCIPATDGCIPPCSFAQRAVVQAQAISVITAASLCWSIFVAEGNGLVSPGVHRGRIMLQCLVLAKTWGSKLCLFSKACRYFTASDWIGGSMHCFQGGALAPSLWLP